MNPSTSKGFGQALHSVVFPMERMRERQRGRTRGERERAYVSVRMGEVEAEA